MSAFETELKRLLVHYRATRKLEDFWPVVLHVESLFWPYFRNRVNAAQDAKGVFHEFVIVLVENRDTLDPLRAPLHWMWKVAARKKVDYFRDERSRQKMFEPFNSEDDFVVEHRSLEALLNAVIVQDRLKTLKPEDQQLVRLYFMEDYRRKETAEFLGRSEKSVKNRLERLTIVLNELLDGLDEGERR
jgi:RNA polymerase sigma factor (sigma-70 family)